MKPFLLMTRPPESSGDTVEIIQAAGFHPLFAPALRIDFKETPLPDPSRYDAAIFSSQNAVRGIKRLQPQPGWFSRPCYCVGDRTAALAHEAGFQNIYSARGAMTDMAGLIKKGTVPPCRMAHFRGQDLAEDPATLLREDQGWFIDPVILYKAEAIRDLPDDVVAALGEGKIKGVLFYSPRSARAFLDALGKAGFASATSGMKAFCLSSAVVESLGHTLWLEILVAPTPDQTGMKAILT